VLISIVSPELLCRVPGTIVSPELMTLFITIIVCSQFIAHLAGFGYAIYLSSDISGKKGNSAVLVKAILNTVISLVLIISVIYQIKGM
jgi:hypothetical protein